MIAKENKMLTLSDTFTLKSIEPLGENGMFRTGFALKVTSNCSDCMIVTSLARYFGKEAPTIEFVLTTEEKNVYASHRYRVGKPG